VSQAHNISLLPFRSDTPTSSEQMFLIQCLIYQSPLTTLAQWPLYVLLRTMS